MVRGRRVLVAGGRLCRLVCLVARGLLSGSSVRSRVLGLVCVFVCVCLVVCFVIVCVIVYLIVCVIVAADAVVVLGFDGDVGVAGLGGDGGGLRPVALRRVSSAYRYTCGGAESSRQWRAGSLHGRGGRSLPLVTLEPGDGAGAGSRPRR